MRRRIGGSTAAIVSAVGRCTAANERRGREDCCTCKTAAYPPPSRALLANQVAVEKKGKGGKTKLIAKTGGAGVRQWDIMKMMVPGEWIEITLLLMKHWYE